MVLSATLLKVQIRGKVEQSRERSSTLPYSLVLIANENGAFGFPMTMVAKFISLKVNIIPRLEFELTYFDSSTLATVGSDCGVMVNIVGNGHSDTSSNPRVGYLHFT